MRKSCRCNVSRETSNEGGDTAIVSRETMPGEKRRDVSRETFGKEMRDEDIDSKTAQTAGRMRAQTGRKDGAGTKLHVPCSGTVYLAGRNRNHGQTGHIRLVSD